MLRKCPHHELPVWRQVQTFYNGVTLANRATIDAAAGGTIMKKSRQKLFNIIDEIVTNLYSYGQERANKRPADIHSIDAVSTLSAQMNAQITAPTQKWTTLGPRYGMVHRWALEPRLPDAELRQVLEGGASVNLMPYSIFEKFGMHELTPSTITLQLADRSIKYPRGIVEDVLDMKEEHEEVLNFVDTGQEVKSKLQKEFLLNGSTSNLKVKPPFEVSSDRKKTSEGKWGRPNRMKRWRNQVDENVGFYKEHTKAWNESHMKKKKFKDGDKRHHKNKSPIKVDWQTLKHYIEGTQPPRLEPPLQLSTN
ncbi:UNVERIFIED_CONTAM: hypothetical protein Slati_3818300 [Sesamum latifolium]|uniref:Uncharacterized protein n=1 Tax=Sesamum latifolium TaxID=2727402 RepID=A0AAW2U9I6_9LAMI